jgi:hypothetical protein
MSRRAERKGGRRGPKTEQSRRDNEEKERRIRGCEAKIAELCAQLGFSLRTRRIKAKLIEIAKRLAADRGDQYQLPRLESRFIEVLILWFAAHAPEVFDPCLVEQLLPRPVDPPAPEPSASSDDLEMPWLDDDDLNFDKY